MNGFLRVGISAYLAFVCAIVLNLVFGTSGLINYRELNEYKISIEENIWNLNDINSDLIVDADNLRYHSDDVKLQARELGWFEPNEGIIVVNGYKLNNSGYSLGKLMNHEKIGSVKSHSNLIIAMIAGISFYILSGFVFNFRLRK